MDRNEDQKFIATYGRDKTFEHGLEGSLENCEDLIKNWFMSGLRELENTTVNLGDYEIEFRHQHSRKSDPIAYFSILFIAKADFNPSAKWQKPANSALVIQLLWDNSKNGKPWWRIRFPNKAKIGTAYTKLVNEMVRQRLKAE